MFSNPSSLPPVVVVVLNHTSAEKTGEGVRVAWVATMPLVEPATEMARLPGGVAADCAGMPATFLVTADP